MSSKSSASFYIEYILIYSNILYPHNCTGTYRNHMRTFRPKRVLSPDTWPVTCPDGTRSPPVEPGARPPPVAMRHQGRSTSPPPRHSK